MRQSSGQSCQFRVFGLQSLSFLLLVRDFHREEFRRSELVSGMRQLAGTRTRYRKAHTAPLAGLVFGRAKYNAAHILRKNRRL